MSKYKLIATATFGLESVVAKELKKLGFEDLKIFNGGVEFSGTKEDICKCNLWLRSSDRVFIKISEFKATSFEELFQNIKIIEWNKYLGKDACFPVYAKSVKSKLFSLSDIQSISKKAVVESLKNNYNVEWFEENGSRFPIHISILKDQASVLLDTSGEGLNRRGYRIEPVLAPIKETMAAALILLSNWYPDKVLIDPFCGSGTIPIEAAMIARNIAPGLNRKFISETWDFIPSSIWKSVRMEAYSSIDLNKPLNIQGYDIDKRAIKAAKANAVEAGVEESIHFQVRDVSELSSSDKKGCLITNPPYGERLETKESSERLYRLLGERLMLLENWSYFIITAHEHFESAFGIKSDKNRKLYNGRIKSYYYQYFNKNWGN
ncbi:MAG TPA: class I SAM-dependent RNA methyltransferase [Clostridia bacterium]|nr:class I SAM-dependent RNA methyltransferase [Clostridia bacterium]